MKNPSLTVYSLTLDPGDLQSMKRNIWRDSGVPGILSTGGRQVPVIVSYRGAHTRKFKKKSYFIRFPGTGREVHLNAEYIDDSLIRNKLSLDFFSRLGVTSPRSRHVWLQINARDEGVYLELEAVDAFFFRRRGLPSGPVYYAVDDDANFSLISPFNDKVKKDLLSGYERKEGSAADDESLHAFLKTVVLTPKAAFPSEITNHLNVGKYLRWLAGVVCTQNFDGFIHNYALYRNGKDGRFEIIPWDFDATWGRDCNGDMMEHDYIPVQGYNTLSARLLDVPAFRRRYRQILRRILKKDFTRSALQPEIERRYRQLDPYVKNDPYKKKRYRQFRSEYRVILGYIPKRNRYLRSHLSGLKQPTSPQP